jgi:UDP-N-acetylglucosamine 2-epimerase
MKPAIIPGTRPEIIKMIPVIRECEKPDNKVHII